MAKKKRNVLLNSKIAVGFIVSVMLVLGVIQIAQGFIDTHDYREKIIKIVKDKTGRDISIKGAVTVALLPVPTLYLGGVELRDDDNDETPSPALTVDMVRLNVAVTSLFSEHPRVTGISLQKPVLEIVRAKDNLIHWEWLNADLMKSLIGGGDSGSPLSAEITEGSLVYHDNRTEKGISINNITASAVGGSQLLSKGSFTMYGHDVKFLITNAANATPLPAGSMPLTVKFYTNDKNKLQLQGSMDTSGELPKIKGALTFEVEDILNWVQAKKKHEKSQLFEQLTSGFMGSAEDKSLLPLKITGEWSQVGTNIELDHIQQQGLDSAAVGKVSLTWTDWRPLVTADLDFSALNYDQWKQLFTKMMEDTPEAALEKIYNKDNEQPENPFPKYLQVDTHLSTDKLYIGSQIWQKATLSANLDDAVVTINQFNMELPGVSSVALFGIVSQGSTGGMRFDGSMEAQGKSLRRMMTVLDESASDLPETYLGQFSVRSNIFISSDQVRLSESDVKISELHLNGGLVVYYDNSSPRVEADVKLNDINFDYFRDIWRGKVKKDEKQKENFFLKFDKNMSFNWLKKLRSTIDFRVNVDHFTFLDRQGDSASFRLFIREGEFGVYDIRFYYPTDSIEASISLSVYGDKPFINVIFNADQLNTAYFDAEAPDETPPLLPGKENLEIVPQSQIIVTGSKPAMDKPAGDKVMMPSPDKTPSSPDKMPASPAPAESPQSIGKALEKEEDTSVHGIPSPKTPADASANMPADASVNEQDSDTSKGRKWSKELIDTSWMEGFDGAFDISVGRLMYGDLTFNQFKLQTKMENNLLTIQNLTFSYWRGRCSVLGSMYGGRVPGVSVSYTLYGVDLHDLLHDVAGRDNISGKANITGILTTSGVNYLSWVKQSDAKMILAARDVTVQGVNLPGVVDAVKVSRTAADVFNNVNRSLVKGSSTFAVDGNINVKNGIMRTPGITLRTGAIIGDFVADVRLVPWTINVSTLFQFPELPSETTPTMTVQIAGPVAEGGDLRTDTSSLEAYVTAHIKSSK